MIFRNSHIIIVNIIFICYIINYKVIAKHEKQKRNLNFNHPYAFEDVQYPKSPISKYSLKNSLRNDIRRAFQPMKIKEDLLNHMIELMCKRIQEDPVYIFKLPMSEHNFKNLIIHRNDFEIPIYPNLTETHMQLAKLSKRIDLNIMPGQPTTYSNWFQEFPYVLNNDEDLSSNDKLQDEIVKTNTVTETNFINYVIKVNNKGEKYLKKEKPNDLRYDYFNNDYSSPYKIENYKLSQSNEYGEPKVKLMKNYLSNPKIDWEELGINNGEFYQPKYRLSSVSIDEDNNSYEDSNEFKINKKLYHMQQIPGDYGFFDKTEKNSKWDLPGKLSSVPLKMQDKYIVDNNDFLKNMTILLTKESIPHWSLTARKDAHKEFDIYIGRANDPFGHSTKWILRNQTNSILNSIDNRKKRGIKELYSMIKCSTGCDPIIYKGYGCFCGFMGSGVPVDGIDRCCKKHDDCYTQSNCPSYLEYFIPFLWKCYKGKPLCAYSHGEWGGPRSCAAQLCQCDLELAKCLRKFHCPRKRAVCKSSYVRMIQNYLMIY